MLLRTVDKDNGGTFDDDDNGCGGSLDGNHNDDGSAFFIHS